MTDEEFEQKINHFVPKFGHEPSIKIAKLVGEYKRAVEELKTKEEHQNGIPKLKKIIQTNRSTIAYMLENFM